jgi:hypothetical protein
MKGILSLVERRLTIAALRAGAVVLIGKDGGDKLTSASPLDAARLFATIDATPMRREEKRRRCR